MAAALTATDISAVVIGTTRSGNADGWYYRFDTIDDVTGFGTIYDNANSFTDGSTGTAAAVKIGVVADSDTIAIQDFDFITITGSGGNLGDVSPLVVWLPALAVADELFIDTDGNTWYDSALTEPAGGVLAPSDSFTPADALLVATEILSDSFTPADAITATIIDSYLSDSVTMNETFTATLVALTMYFNEYIDMQEALTLSTYLLTLYFNDHLYADDNILDSISMSFSEDTQVDFTWSEV